MSFLDDVLLIKRREVEALRMSRTERPSSPRPDFAKALRAPGLSVIAEIKRRSPSKGLLAPGLDAGKTALSYREGGAAAISCLTDREFFGAQPDDLTRAKESGLPVLRKDFIIDELQIEESAALGASAVLLIVRILDAGRLQSLLTYARERSLDTLVEVHDQSEIDQALIAGASIIGVNNRDLGTLVVDPGLAQRLRRHIPSGVLAVAESGVKNRDDVKAIEGAGFDAVLIGEALASSPDPAGKLRELLGETEEVRR